MAAAGAILAFISLAASAAGLVLTCILVWSMHFGKPSFASQLKKLRKEHPYPGVESWGVSVELVFLASGLEADITEFFMSVGFFVSAYIQRCASYGCDAHRWEERFRWKVPSSLFSVNFVRLLLLGSIWNKGRFYGLFCWAEDSPLRWQDVIPHLLVLIHWRAPPEIPSGLSRSGAPNTCEFNEKLGEKIRGLLLNSFLIYFILLPTSFGSWLWNNDKLSEGEDATYIHYIAYCWVTIRAVICAAIVGFLVTVKAMLSLGAFVTIQAYYMAINNHTPISLAVVAAVLAAISTSQAWTVMQAILHSMMFEKGLCLKDGQGYKISLLPQILMSIAGTFSALCYALSSSPLRHSLIMQLDFAVGISWLVIALSGMTAWGRKLFRVFLAVPTVCAFWDLPSWVLNPKDMPSDSGVQAEDFIFPV